MIEYMRLQSDDGTLSWEDFMKMITTLMPMNLESQITLFLRSYVPKYKVGEQIDKHKFSKADILRICRDCLEPMFSETNDKFFNELS